MKRREIRTHIARASQVMGSLPARPNGFDALRVLASHQLWIGVPRSTALEHYRPFPLLEMELRREALPSEQVFRFLIEHSHARLQWHVTIDDMHEAKPFSSENWKLFMALLIETSDRDHTLILSYDRSVPYTASLLDSIECLREELPGIPLLLDTEHASWKTKRAELVMKSLKLPHVFVDAPFLPGIVKDAAYDVGPVALVRCLGRNNRTWFEHAPEDRFAYTYSPNELSEIAERVKLLKQSYDRVCVTFCNRPAPQAILNALQLGELLS